MKKIICFALIICTCFLGGCNRQETEAIMLVTEIIGDKSLGRENLEELLHKNFDGITVEYNMPYKDECVEIFVDDIIEVEKTQEAIDQKILDDSFMSMVVARTIVENYNYDGYFQVVITMNINDSEVKIYSNSSSFDYLEGDNNYDLLNSYMKNTIITVTGNQNTRQSILKAFAKHFNIAP